MWANNSNFLPLYLQDPSSPLWGGKTRKTDRRPAYSPFPRWFYQSHWPEELLWTRLHHASPPWCRWFDQSPYRRRFVGFLSLLRWLAVLRRPRPRPRAPSPRTTTTRRRRRRGLGMRWTEQRDSWPCPGRRVGTRPSPMDPPAWTGGSNWRCRSVDYRAPVNFVKRHAKVTKTKTLILSSKLFLVRTHVVQQTNTPGYCRIRILFDNSEWGSFNMYQINQSIKQARVKARAKKPPNQSINRWEPVSTKSVVNQAINRWGEV